MNFGIDPVFISGVHSMLAGIVEDASGDIAVFRNNLRDHLDELTRDAHIYLKATQKKAIIAELRVLQKAAKGMSDEDIMTILCDADDFAIDSAMREVGVMLKMPRDIRRQARREANDFFKTKFNSIQREYREIERLLESKKISTRRPVVSEGSCTKQPVSNSPGVKKGGTLDAIIGASQMQPASKHTPEQRIDRIHARLVNILSGEIQQRHINEVKSIQERIDLLRQQASMQALSDTICHLNQLVHDILDAGADPIASKSIPSKPTQEGSMIESLSRLSQANIDMIEHIRHFRTEVLTFALSSKKGGESSGDGNFIAYVWRPFFTLLESSIRSGGIDIDHFSWKGVVDHIYAVHDGITSKVRLQHFLHLLSRSSQVGDLSQNWDVLIQAIEEFSCTPGFYHHTHGKTPLKNILEKLKNMPVLQMDSI